MAPINGPTPGAETDKQVVTTAIRPATVSPPLRTSREAAWMAGLHHNRSHMWVVSYHTRVLLTLTYYNLVVQQFLHVVLQTPRHERIYREAAYDRLTRKGRLLAALGRLEAALDRSPKRLHEYGMPAWVIEVPGGELYVCADGTWEYAGFRPGYRRAEGIFPWDWRLHMGRRKPMSNISNEDALYPLLGCYLYGDKVEEVATLCPTDAFTASLEQFLTGYGIPVSSLLPD